MGKSLDLLCVCIAHRSAGPADIPGRWPCLGLPPCTHEPLHCLLDRIGWLARPWFALGCVLAGAKAWLLWGPSFALPFSVLWGLLEAIAAGARRWEPQPLSGPALRIFTDASPPSPSDFFAGVWSSVGVPTRPAD